jgi:hypothetical protein
MFDGNDCWWFEYSTRIADRQQGREFFAGEHFRPGDHHPSMAPFRIAEWSILLGSTNKPASVGAGNAR